MPQVCLYFQLHQPYRLKNLDVMDLGNDDDFFADKKEDKNKIIFQKVAKKSYLPMLKLLLKLCQQQPNFKFALSASGVFLEQAQAYQPEILELLQKIYQTGQLEILAETYYHSLAFLYSEEEFRYQIKKHSALIKKLFGQKPTVFRNTELIYSNKIASQIEPFKFKGILTEAVDRYLAGQNFTQVFLSRPINGSENLPILLKHAKLSDDIAFRFSNKSWAAYPLFADRYLDWIEVYPETELVNLFMDFETFGEHQWQNTGIFDFFKNFVRQFLKKSWNHFVTPTEVFKNLKTDGHTQLPIYNVPQPISWADVDRDLTAWIDNPFQHDTLRLLYKLEQPILNSRDKKLINIWRKLQTSDHFYYMCTKWSADGDVHAYFNPYHSPYEAYRRYSIALAALQQALL